MISVLKICLLFFPPAYAVKSITFRLYMMVAFFTEPVLMNFSLFEGHSSIRKFYNWKWHFSVSSHSIALTVAVVKHRVPITINNMGRNTACEKWVSFPMSLISHVQTVECENISDCFTGQEKVEDS